MGYMRFFDLGLPFIQTTFRQNPQIDFNQSISNYERIRTRYVTYLSVNDLCGCEIFGSPFGSHLKERFRKSENNNFKN
jgi:hypothetical protein